MIVAPILGLLLQAATPATPPPAVQISPEDSGLLFLFYRLRYFHDVAALRRCARAMPERARAANERYDALRTRLSARLGAGHVDFRGSGNGALEREPDRDCRMGITFPGYENALNDLERRLGPDTK